MRMARRVCVVAGRRAWRSRWVGRASARERVAVGAARRDLLAGAVGTARVARCSTRPRREVAAGVPCSRLATKRSAHSAGRVVEDVTPVRSTVGRDVVAAGALRQEVPPPSPGLGRDAVVGDPGEVTWSARAAGGRRLWTWSERPCLLSSNAGGLHLKDGAIWSSAGGGATEARTREWGRRLLHEAGRRCTAAGTEPRAGCIWTAAGAEPRAGV